MAPQKKTQKKSHLSPAHQVGKNASRVIDRLLEILWLAVIFLVPLFFVPQLPISFELPKITLFRTIVLVMFIAWTIKMALEERSQIPPLKKIRWPLLFLGIFAGIAVLATAFSVAPMISMTGWYPRFQGLFSSFLCYGLFGIIIFTTLKTAEQRHRLTVTILCSAIVAALLALLQKFIPGFLNFWDDGEFLGRVYGTMGNPDFLGSFLALTMPLIAFQLFRSQKSEKPIKTIAAASALMVSFVALLFTFSRAAYLGTFIGFIFLLFIAGYKRNSRKIFHFTVVLTACSLFSVVLLNIFATQSWIQNNPFLSRLTLQTEKNISSVESRLVIWPAVIRQILDRPVLGYGPETFALSFQNYAPRMVNTDPSRGAIPDRSHNELLDMAVQIGIPGLLAYLGFIITLFISCTKKILKSEQDWTFHLALLSGLLSLIVANQFGFSVTVHFIYSTLFISILLRFITTQASRE